MRKLGNQDNDERLPGWNPTGEEGEAGIGWICEDGHIHIHLHSSSLLQPNESCDEIRMDPDQAMDWVAKLYDLAAEAQDD